ncbi:MULTISPECIES: hypothetical protein [unclassified Pseudonocardia]|uniref:hypothetical protein n=1 Tax=unclassified Pseudonocardia TaxID=2619320 RepID=UPI0001FFEC30|nr:hypothetical protein [Pseudonocardia sp. Ae707_Ps1]OLM21290.1 hypothetical protein Ae707Ps1_5549c [Pseudonocardia sp. Ae707_Ps1]
MTAFEPYDRPPHPAGEGWGTGPARGEGLRPVRRRDVLHRMLYEIARPGPYGGTVRYTVEVDAGEGDGSPVLYVDGRRAAEAESPASFPVHGGVVEVEVSLYGMGRVHFVGHDGTEQRLAPVPGTLEHLRGHLHHRNPRLSRGIGRVAIAVLVVNLVLAVPQALELVTGIDRVAELVGTFTSPVHLPYWLNTGLLLAGALAAVERTLTLRRNRVLDVETLWTNF